MRVHRVDLFDLVVGSCKLADRAHTRQASGRWVIPHTVPVAVFAFFRHADDHAEGFRQVILCVGDTDTVAAIAGAMIGARVGVSV